MPPDTHRVKIDLECNTEGLSIGGVSLKKGQIVTTKLRLTPAEIESLQCDNPVVPITQIIRRELLRRPLPKDGISIICDIEGEKSLLPGRAVRVTGKWGVVRSREDELKFRNGEF